MHLKQWILVVATLTLGTYASAQYVPLYKHDAQKVSLSFDLDRLWTYNLYERSRWGGGLKFSLRDSIDMTGYVGYGVRDQQWKGGVGFSAKLPWSHRAGTVYLGLARDYHAAASRRMQQSNITDLGGMSSFMSMFMDDRRMLTAGYRFYTRRATYIVEGRFFEGYRLYDWYGPIYLVDGASPRRSDGWEVSLTMHRRSGFSAEMLVAKRSNWRLLLQYDRRFDVGPLDLYTFAQTGICANHASFYYRFDLGGTYGSPLWFRNSMLTLRPYEYVAHRFAFASLRLQLHKPLFSLWNKTFAIGSNPRPMVGVNGVMGGKYTDDWDPNAEAPADLRMTAVELMAGVDGIIRWGVADYGVVLGMRPWPLIEGKPLTVILLMANLAI